MRFICMFAAAVLSAASPTAIAQSGGSQTIKARAVQANIDAYRARSMARYLATFSKDATVTTNGVVIARGHDEIRALYLVNFDPASPRIRIVDSGMDGDRVYLSVAYRMIDGNELCCSYSLYTVNGGKITDLEVVS